MNNEQPTYDYYKGHIKFIKQKEYDLNNVDKIRNSKLAHKRTITGLLNLMYRNQVERSKKRKQPPPAYTLKEFINIIINILPGFYKLYDAWKLSNYKKQLRPSVDRLNSKLPYVLGNIELVTWEINDKRGRMEKQRGVSIYTLEGKFIKKFDSIRSTAKYLNVNKSTVSRVARGIKRKCKETICIFTDEYRIELLALRVEKNKPKK